MFLLSFILAIENVLEKTRLTKQLEKSEERFQPLVENLPNAIFWLSCNLRYIYISPQVPRKFGIPTKHIPTEQFLGKTGREL